MEKPRNWRAEPVEVEVPETDESWRMKELESETLATAGAKEVKTVTVRETLLQNNMIKIENACFWWNCTARRWWSKR